jgi:hypothetical protein
MDLYTVNIPVPPQASNIKLRCVLGKESGGFSLLVTSNIGSMHSVCRRTLPTVSVMFSCYCERDNCGCVKNAWETHE